MTSLAIEGAFAFAWWNYLLRHSSVSEDDNGVPPFIATSLIFVVPANTISLSCK